MYPQRQTSDHMTNTDLVANIDHVTNIDELHTFLQKGRSTLLQYQL
jgi:hypothetical protein